MPNTDPDVIVAEDEMDGEAPRGSGRSKRSKRRPMNSRTHPTIQAKQNHFDDPLEVKVSYFSHPRESWKDILHRQKKNICRLWRRKRKMYLITTLSPAPHEVAPINKLPKECILRIFSYLSIKEKCRCAQVCQLWNYLALDGMNWQRVDLFTFQKDVKAHVVDNLARRCGGFLKELSLKGCENIQDSTLRTFAARCKNIEVLSLFKCKRVTDMTCENLGRYCHKLKHLNLENCTSITDRACKSISEGCSLLEYLNISWCDSVTDRGVQWIVAACPNLATLHLRGCEGLTERCFQGVETKMTSLTRLNLWSCFVTDDTVNSIASGCPNLEYLNLAQCNQITDRSLIALAQSCKKLTAIELSGCSLLSDAGFSQLARNCKGLEKMDLEDCVLISDASIHCLSTNCRNLAELSLSHCELITDESINYLMTNNKDNIRVLELDNCPAITDLALGHLRHARALKRIDLYDCQNVSKDAIQRFKHHRPGVDIHAYFAPATPPAATNPVRAGVFQL